MYFFKLQFPLLLNCFCNLLKHLQDLYKVILYVVPYIRFCYSLLKFETYFHMGHQGRDLPMEDCFGQFRRFSTIGICFGRQIQRSIKSTKCKICRFNLKSTFSPFFIEVSSIIRDHPFKTSACHRGGGVSPLPTFADARGEGFQGCRRLQFLNNIFYSILPI